MGQRFQVLILNAFKNHQKHWIEIYQSQTMTFTLLFSERSAKMTDSSLRASYPGHSGGWARKGRRACNYVSSTNSPVAPTQLSCQISANHREVETSTNVNKHWKTSALGNDVITNVISNNQHFA